jgi:divalent metal cation (Fe/Co/Zn/Cd) transporter
MFSASVVILGLALTAYAELTRRDGVLVKADAVAALVVGLVIIAMSGRLALRAVDVLLDRAPADVRARLTRAIASVPGVLTFEPVRVRESGSRLFADVVVGVPRTTSLAAAHTISEQVEAAIRAVEPHTETVVHVEPVVSDTESAADRVRAVALQLGAHTHHEQVSRVGDHLEASVHLEVAPDLTLGEAHNQAHDLVTAIKRSDRRVERVDTHIEVAEPDPDPRRDITRERKDVVDALARTVWDVDGEAQIRQISLFRSDEPGLDLVLHCGFPRGARMGETHRRTERIEQALRERYPDLQHIVIHAEPDDTSLTPAEVHGRGHTVGTDR